MAGVTFQVSDKAAALVGASGSRERGKGLNLEALPPYEQQGCVELIQSTHCDDDAARTFVSASNGFVHSVCDAYNRHHHLVLRPDDVWLAIVAQFGLFVNSNAEAMRSCFVDHKGKKQLVVEAAGTLHTASYAALAKAMSNELRKNVNDENLCDWVLPDFSTTTDNDRVVGSVLLMATLKHYFEYKFGLCCGIPTVTLLGTVRDWEKVHSRVEQLSKYGGECEEWCSLLKKVTGQLVASSRGDVDTGFWSRVCDYRGGGSGPTYLSGWITAFCVFNKDGRWQGQRRGGGGFPMVDTSNIPPGYLTVDVIVDDNGTEHETLMFAGHLGYDVVKDGMGVSPKLAWAIVRKDKGNKMAAAAAAAAQGRPARRARR